MMRSLVLTLFAGLITGVTGCCSEGKCPVDGGQSVDAQVWDADSSDALVEPDMAHELAAPTNLVATSGAAQVSLTWDAASGATGYSLRRSLAAGGPYSDVATSTVNSHVDLDLEGETAYYYVVYAVYDSGSSGPSNEASAKTTCALPSTNPPLMPNGPVYAVLQRGCTVYVGGKFTAVGSYTGGGASLNATTGARDPIVAPVVDGKVLAVVTDGNGGWYVGGQFTSIAGVVRNNLARVNGDGTIHDWDPNANDAVDALAVSGDGLKVYVGGYFTQIGHVAQMRNRIAAIDVDGNADPNWDPNADGPVYALAVSGSTVYVGGGFFNIGNVQQMRNRIAAIEASGNGAATSWDPNANGAVYALAVSKDGQKVYVGGEFTQIGHVASPPFRRFVAAIAVTTGNATLWNPNPYGSVYALAVSESTVYVGGSFYKIGQPSMDLNNIAAINVNGLGSVTGWNGGTDDKVWALALHGATVYAGGAFRSANGIGRDGLAAFAATNGNLQSWKPLVQQTMGIKTLAVSDDGAKVYTGGYVGMIGGEPRGGLAAFNTNGSLRSWNPGVKECASPPCHVGALAATDSTLYVGGYFKQVGSETRNYLAAFDANGALDPWNPEADDGVLALAVSGSTVYAGGAFGSIGGKLRNHAAAIDANGKATSWDPNASDEVDALAVSGPRVYLGGQFMQIGNNPRLTRSKIAAIDLNGNVDPNWDPNADSQVRALAVSGATVYAGGNFWNIGNVQQPRNHIAAIDVNGNGDVTSWDPNANNPVYALMVSGSTVYAAGNFSMMGTDPRNAFAAIDTNGTVTIWNPNATMENGDPALGLALAGNGQTFWTGGSFSQMGGTPYFYLAPLDPVTGTLQP